MKEIRETESKGFIRRNIWKSLGIALFAVLVIVGSSFFIYTMDYYKADTEVMSVVAAARDENIKIISDGDYTIFKPNNLTDINVGYIFYPGGKVEETAYLPLLNKLAENGVTCVLVKMPLRLAVFGINKADDVYSKVPEIEKWYIGGHSLGGAMSATYAAKRTDKIAGLILLAAYPSDEVDMPIIAIYGSEDQILNRSKLAIVNNVQVIMGGNHAQFGDYGKQKGDGVSAITHEDQQAQTVELILKFIQDNN